MKSQKGSNNFPLDDQTELPVDENDPLVGEVLFGKFEVLERLGAGGVGIVYKVREKTLKRIMALKLLNTTAVDQNTVVRFQNEARTLSKLKHFSIAMVYDFGVEKGKPYMAIEYIDGITLQQWLAENGPLSLYEFVCIFIDVCDALAFSHQRGIVHRDVKPGNIMLIPDAVRDTLSVKVLDFGIAKRYEDDDDVQQLTVDGSIIGTPLYMSPEQASGKKATMQSDMYSLGCVMYECLVGEPPFRGNTKMETLVEHQEKTFPSLREIFDSQHLPDEIVAVIERLTAKVPGDRYESLSAVKAILETLSEESVQSIEDDTARDAARIESDNGTENGAVRWFNNLSKEHRFLLAACSLALIGVIVLVTTKQVLHETAPEKAPQVKLSNSHNLTEMMGDVGNHLDSAQQAMKMRMTTLELQVGEWKDSELELIKNYEIAKVLKLQSCVNITDAGLNRLEKLVNLEVLNISSTKVHTLDVLPNFTKLERLEMQHTLVDDRALDNLKTLTRLHTVDLRGTRVTTAGLRKLIELPDLNGLAFDLPDDKKSMADYLKLVKQYPSSKMFSANQMSKQIDVPAQELLSERKGAEALPNFLYMNEVLQTRSHPEMLSLIAVTDNIALCYDNMHNTEMAEQYFKKALALADRTENGDGQYTAYGNAIAHYVRKDPARAQSLFKRFIELSERNPDYDAVGLSKRIEQLADVAYARKQLELSLQWYEAALAKVQGRPEAVVAQYRYRADRASVLRLTRRRDEAAREFEAVMPLLKKQVKLPPDEVARIASFHGGLAQLTVDLGHADRAVAVIDEGIAYLDNYDEGAVVASDKAARQAMIQLLNQKISWLKAMRIRGDDVLSAQKKLAALTQEAEPKKP